MMAMTMKDTAEAVRESSMWNLLSTGERIGALLYALDRSEDPSDRYGHSDVTDIVGEVYSDRAG